MILPFDMIVDDDERTAINDRTSNDSGRTDAVLAAVNAVLNCHAADRKRCAEVNLQPLCGSSSGVTERGSVCDAVGGGVRAGVCGRQRRCDRLDVVPIAICCTRTQEDGSDTSREARRGSQKKGASGRIKREGGVPNTVTS